MSKTMEMQPALQVLIVEDNDAHRNILLDLIGEEGFDTVACASAAEAIRMVQQEDFAIAILDDRLPDMSGTELLERAGMERRGIRAIIHTGFGSFESAKAALNRGAFAYVEKLGHPEELIRHVHRAAQHWMAAALQRSQADYRRLLEHLPVGVYRTAPDGRILEANPAMADLFGVEDVAALQQLNAGNLYLDVSEREHHLAQLSASTVHAAEFALRRADGAALWVRDYPRAIRDETGAVAYFDGVLVDITERKHAEEALRKSEKSFRLMFADNPMPMWVFDRETLALLDVNKAALAHYGYTREEFLAMGLDDILAGEDVSWIRAYASSLSDQPVKAADWQHRTKDGAIIDVEITAHALMFGERSARLVLANDITEQKRLQKEILEISSREQRRIGQDLHDELGQVLTGIGFRVQALEDDLRKAGLAIVADAGEIGDLVARAIAQTRALARGLNPVNVEQQSLIAALKELILSVEDIYGIPCSFSCSQPVRIEDQDIAIHLYRIVQESLNNAVKHAGASRIEVRLFQEDGMTTLRVSDDGRGLSTEHRSRQGMGLRIMDYRARMIGATLTVQPGPERGTIITCQYVQHIVPSTAA